MSQRPAIHMEKQLGWACKLGGAESLGISKAGQTVLASLMESQAWHQPASCVALGGEGSEKGQNEKGQTVEEEPAKIKSSE